MSTARTRNFEEHVQMLMDSVGIWRPDEALLSRADVVLGLADDSEEEGGPRNVLWEKHSHHKLYCDQKMNFLLDLADEDPDDAIEKSKLHEKACQLWGDEGDCISEQEGWCQSNNRNKLMHKGTC